MQKYLELVIELLEIPNKDEILHAGEMLVQYPKHTLKIAHTYGFVFEAYKDLLNEKITPEEFIKVGDVDGAYPVGAHTDPFVFLQSLSYETDNVVAIVDKITEQEIDDIFLPKNVLLVFC